MTLKIQPPKPLSPVLKHDPSVRQFDMDIQLLYEALVSLDAAIATIQEQLAGLTERVEDLEE